MRTQSVILNLIPSGVNPIVHLSQYDQEDDGALLFNIYDGNVLADLTGCTATIEGTKPDGTFFMYPCTVYSTYLTSAVKFQMTSIAGSYPAEVRINRGAENVGTINITMMVEPAGVGRVDVSDTEIPSLLDDIETSVDEAEYWAHVAEQAVTGVASWNGRTGAVVPVTGDYNASQVDYDNTNSGSTATNTQDAIDERAPKKIITTNDAFDPTKTYSAGEWFIHQGVLYEVITACTGVTPPNVTYYAVKTLHDLRDDIAELKSNFGSKKVVLSSASMSLPEGITLLGENSYVKTGRIVNLLVNLQITSTTKHQFLITNFIPNVKDRPVIDTSNTLGDGVPDGIAQPVNIKTAGTLELWNTKTGTTYAQGNIIYIANDTD